MDGRIQLANKILNNKTNLNQLLVINSITLHSLLSNSNKNMVFCDMTPQTFVNTCQCFKASSSKMLVLNCFIPQDHNLDTHAMQTTKLTTSNKS